MKEFKENITISETKMEDTKKLETLSYKPNTELTGDWRNGGKIDEKLINTSPATMGYNSAVIKPETRVNKTENVDQRFKAPYKINMGTKDNPNYKAIEQPNQNLMKINKIIGLSWIRGNGNGKIVGIYQDYAMVIHPCFGHRPRVVHKDDITLPEAKDDFKKILTSYE